MKKYVSSVLPVIALSLAMCLCGCGSLAELLENAESSEPVIEPVESDPVDVPDATDPLLEGKDVSEDGVLGNWTVALAGADRVEFSDGKSALIVFYDFTNNSEQSISSFLALGFSAYQSGKALFSANTFDSYSYQHNSSLRVRPGTTIRCSALYEYDADAGEIEVQIFDWTGNSNVVVCGTFDAVSLPGESGSFEPNPVASPAWTDGLSNQSIIDGCTIAIDSEHTNVTDLNGNSCVRLSISFENSSEDTKNFSNDFHTYAYQDGIELPSSAASDSLPEDSNAWADIQPGGIVTITLVYQLRSSDPVELEIIGQDGTKIGAEFSIG